MKKILPIVLVVILVLSGLGAVAFPSNEHETNKNHIDYTNDDPLDKKISWLMERCHFPSISACIIKNDQIMWSKGYGYGNIEYEYSATENMVYNVGSTSKTFTGTALMQLYDNNLFDLEDDVNNYLPFILRNPNYPDEPITIRMILSHSSSLREIPQYWDVNLYEYTGPPFDGYPMPWLEDYLVPEGNRYDPLVWDEEYSPGTKFQYANINFDLVAFLVEIISDEPFYEYCKNNIFIPLDMKNTSFHITDFSDEQLAAPYVWDFQNNKLEKMQHMVYLHYPTGGIFTTVKDLSHFLIAHMNGGVYNETRILKESTGV